MRVRAVFSSLLIFGALAILSTAMAGPVLSASFKQDRCVSQLEIKKKVSYKAHISELGLLSAQSYFKHLNITPPPSRLRLPDSILIIKLENTATSVFIFGFFNGCKVGNLQVSKSLHQKVMRTISGKDI